MKLENLVRFSSHPRPFRISECYCDNPECRCKDVFLTFTEVSSSGRSLKEPISFSASIDVETWEERRPPQRAAEVAAWVQEYLDQCPKNRRAEFKASFEQAKRDARRKSTFTIDCDEVLAGTLIPYCDVLSDNNALSSGGGSYTFEFHYRGREYLVEDQYCPNPTCDCQTVHLCFFEVITRADVLLDVRERFVGSVTFASELVVEQRFACDMAEDVLAAWWKEHPRAMNLFKARYKDIKEIGRRSLATRPPTARRVPRPSAKLITDSLAKMKTPTDDPLPATNKVGRNAACPCGSGKKYKKCCQPKTALPL